MSVQIYNKTPTYYTLIKFHQLQTKSIEKIFTPKFQIPQKAVNSPKITSNERPNIQAIIQRIQITWNKSMFKFLTLLKRILKRPDWTRISLHVVFWLALGGLIYIAVGTEYSPTEIQYFLFQWLSIMGYLDFLI